MKEMAFITVAILIPPTLTFLGYVGEDAAPAAQEWRAAERPRGTQPVHELRERGEDESHRWYEASL